MKQVRPSLYAMKMQQTGGQLGTPGGKEGVSANSQPLRLATVGGWEEPELKEACPDSPHVFTVPFCAGPGGHNPKGAGVSKQNLITKIQIFMDCFHTYQMLSLTLLN